MGVKSKYFILGLCLCSVEAFAKVIYGIDHIPETMKDLSYPVDVQVGSYSNEDGAQNMMRRVRAKTQHQAWSQFKSQQYKVLVGPFYDHQSLMDFYRAWSGQEKLTEKRHASVVSRQVFDKDMALTKPSRWYLNGQVGGQFSQFASSTTVNNGSGFPTPYNQDIYSASSSDGALLLGAGLGRRFEWDNPWLTATSLGIHYQYFFSRDIQGEITEFSLPQFKNYSYSIPVASNIIFGQAKFHFRDYRKFAPYVSVGLGGVISKADGYKETAYANITPRISPDFSIADDAQFAYLAGVGIDYPLASQFILSAGYQFSGLGQAKTAHGQGSWSGESLDFGNLYSNAFVFGMTYLFDVNFDFGRMK